MATSESVVVQAPRKSKLIAGLLGLCFGVLGIHWFYLGNKKRGLTQLILFIVGILLCIVLIGIPIMIGVEIWALVDAIRIFTGSINTDSDGLPLKD